MPIELRDMLVVLEDRPGALAALAEVLGAAKVNIEGVCGIPVEGRGMVHVLVRDAAGARRALSAAGIMVQGERDVVVRKATDRPGSLGKLARKLADAGINIDFVYLATNTRVVFGVSDVARAKQAIGGR
jgi:hypothetical protein